MVEGRRRSSYTQRGRAKLSILPEYRLAGEGLAERRRPEAGRTTKKQKAKGDSGYLGATTRWKPEGKKTKSA